MEHRREEDLLRQDGETVRRMQPKGAGGAAEAQRAAAIRRGLERARGADRRGRALVFGGAGAGAAALLAAGAILAYTGPAQPVSGPEASTAAAGNAVRAQTATNPQTEAGPGALLEPFVSLTAQDEAIQSALARGGVEEMDVSIERDGYSLGLRGMVRDSQSLTLFYTLKAPNGEQLSLDAPDLLDAAGASMVRADYVNPYESYDSSDRMTYGYVSLPLVGGAMDAELTEGRLRAYAVSGQSEAAKNRLQTFETSVWLPLNASEEQEVVYSEPKKLTVGGQRILIERVRITPLRIYMQYKIDEAVNDKTIFAFFLPELLLEKNGRSHTLIRDGWGSVLAAANGTTEMIFDNSQGIRDPDSVSFQVGGVNALDKNKLDFVIDTEKMQVLKAPEDGITVSVSPAGEGLRTLQVDYPLEAEDLIGQRELMLGLYFTDGEGVKHKLGADKNGALGKGVDAQSAPGTGSSKIYLEDEDYPQPLTFKIGSYPALIREEASVRLK
ncbi:hypothetical protein QWJ34_16600 [Saccharibacillus sp. CPCC 101409]|uniref:hypothetical protein n=1 Tax=Saccharibacillus sp. CPCC 101409 TaxID=3058041 RepID=UPI002671971E|nr:hypothetical protein [Saccharibacillus sp. CPCC 101409]MDO3411388.1 hypothetical protein [Saccharibacillus sp. CPCC 101409]